MNRCEISRTLKGLLALWLTFLGITVLAQTSVVLNTGYLRGRTGIIFSEHDDQTLSVVYSKSANGTSIDSLAITIIDKQDLSTVQANISKVGLDTSSGFVGGLVEQYVDHNGNYYFVEFGGTNVPDQLVLNIFEVTEDNRFKRNILTKKWANKQLQRMGFVNNEFVIVYSDNGLNYVNFYIDVYDINGYLKVTRSFSRYGGALKTALSLEGNGVLEIKEHPRLPKAFILVGFSQTLKINVVDQITLDTIVTYDARETESDSFGSVNMLYEYGADAFTNRGLSIENDGIVIHGTVTMVPRYLSHSDYFTRDEQFFVFKQYWDGRHEFRDFGPGDINNGFATGYGVNKSTQTHVISGVIPFDDYKLSKDEKREVLIYMYDQWGKYDSIYLFGDKNHEPLKTLVDDNGDVFIAGVYTDAWTTDSTYIWVTKLSGVALSMIEQKKINNHLFLFPNPTVETIQIKEVTKFINGDFEIYSQSGVMVKQGRVTGQEIDVSSFTAGVYVLTVKSQNEEQFNAIFVKE